MDVFYFFIGFLVGSVSTSLYVKHKLKKQAEQLLMSTTKNVPKRSFPADKVSSEVTDDELF